LLQAIKRQNIYEQVIHHLQEFIIDNSIKPGDRLPTETELAQRLGVSRQSIREAVKVLESVGVVETRPRDGGARRRHDTPRAAV
jgi:GntR family transcriptional repressor for pyruvate dehydrogenase complex